LIEPYKIIGLNTTFIYVNNIICAIGKYLYLRDVKLEAYIIMKSRDTGLESIGLGFILLVYSILVYFFNPVVNAVPGLILSFIFIITGLFQNRKYYNKKLYSLCVCMFLVIMWLSILLQFFNPSSAFPIISVYIYDIFPLILTVAIIWFVFRHIPRKWDKLEGPDG
jgi:hypothetical protein